MSLLISRVRVEKNRPFISMFAIDKMSGMLQLAGSICSLASLDITRDTSKRARGCGQPARGVVSGFMKAINVGCDSDQSDRPLMHLDRVGQLTFLTNSLRGTGMRARRSGLRLEG